MRPGSLLAIAALSFIAVPAAAAPCSLQLGTRGTFRELCSNPARCLVVFRNFIECPGYMIEAAGQDYRIYNCEDFGTDLCDLPNLGRKVQAGLHTEARISICLGQTKSFVLDYRFVD